ncbi:MAG: hypothetical protein DCC69_06615 [Hyphomicrobiales bacterium]|nr:MAG: hypothetical protein DCC69_06615 [Hyphomicrobiales bacterium]
MHNATLDATGVPHFRPGGVTPTDKILSSAPERTRQRVQWIADRIETHDASIEGAHHESGHATEAWETAKVNLARLEQQSVLPDSNVPEEMVEAARRKVKAAGDRRDRAMQRHRDLISEREALKVMLGSCSAVLAQKRVEAQDGPGRLAGDNHEPAELVLDEVPVDAPETADACRALVAEATAEITGLYTERQEVEQAPPPPDYAKDSIRLKLERLAAQGKPSVTPPTAEADVTLVWPAKALNAAGRASHPGERPQVADIEAMVARYFGDQILADAEAAVDAAYAAVELVLEPHERRRRLRQIDGKILAAERRECAARWKLIEEFGDEDISFRPGTSPRAILGIA